MKNQQKDLADIQSQKPKDCISQGIKHSSTYKSKFTDRQVTAAQYLAEVACEREFWQKPENKGKDPKIRFWSEPYWAKRFKINCIQMARLEKFGITAPAVSAVLKSQRGRTIYSLGNPILKDLALLEQKKIDSRKEVAINTPSPAPVDESLPTTRKPLRTKKSKFELLNEVRDGEESSGPTGEQG